MLPKLTLEYSTYGLSVFVGILVCIVVAGNRKNKYGYNWRVIFVLFAFAAIGMGVGSKVLFFLTQIPDFMSDVSVKTVFKRLLTSGFVYYGGIYGAIVGTYIAIKVLNLKADKTWNFIVPLFVLFHAFGRIGCFMGGCCYGIPWKYGIAMQATSEIPRFPTQLLESAIEFMLFAIMLFKEKKESSKSNFLEFYMMTYAFCRFFVEFLRGDQVRGIWFGGLSTSQYIAIASFVFWGNIYVKRKLKKENG